MNLLRRTIYIALATALLLELVLQVLAVAFWLFGSKPEVEVPPGHKVVLCVGDSFTFGMGASDRAGSYPAQLERIVRDRVGADWSVVNAGHPGNSSREVLIELGRQIDSVRPRAVCVVVGANDDWSLPEPLTLYGEDPEQWLAPSEFRFEYRTWRLIRTARSRRPFDTAATSKSNDPGPAAPRPKSKAEPIETLVEPRMERELFATWRAAREALASGALDRAEAKGLELLARAGEDSELAAIARAHLARVYSKRGATAKLDATLADLRSQHERRPRERTAVEWLQAMRDLGREAAALEFARAMSERYPDSARVHGIRAFLEMQHGRHEYAAHAIDRAIALEDPGAEGRYRSLLRTRFQILRETDAEAALASLLASHEFGATVAETRMLLQFAAWDYDREAFAQRVDAVVSDPVARRELLSTYDSIVDQGETQRKKIATYRWHLEQVIARCRQAGARVVFASYPHQQDTWYRREAEQLADEAGVIWADTATAVGEALTADPTAELFVADGHCNDAGYRLMAEAIADALAPSLR